MTGEIADMAIEIVRWHDDHQPGIVECRFTDAHGKTWTGVEKAPIITAEQLYADSSYPRPGILRGIVVAVDGEIATVDTEKPWGVEDVDGVTRFDVRHDQLTII